MVARLCAMRTTTERSGREVLTVGRVVPHMVDQSVFGALSNKLRGAQGGVCPRRVDGEGPSRGQMVFPGQGVNELVELVGVAGITAIQYQHDARCEARPKACHVSVIWLSLE